MSKFKLNPATRRPPTSRRRSRGSPRASRAKAQFQTLLGATGTGKTFTMGGGTIERVARPALLIAHNKTLAAQLCNEFRESSGTTPSSNFVSYYDYYQPEAYVPAQISTSRRDSSITTRSTASATRATASLFAART